MIRGTTPDYILNVSGEDLRDKTVYVTISQGTKKITMSNDEIGINSDGTDSVIDVRLTQEQTLGFQEGNAKIQVRFINSQGNAEATEIVGITILPVLLERVIEYNGNS